MHVRTQSLKHSNRTHTIFLYLVSGEHHRVIVCLFPAPLSAPSSTTFLSLPLHQYLPLTLTKTLYQPQINVHCLHKILQQGPGGYNLIVIPHNGDKDVPVFWSVEDIILHNGGIAA